MSENEQDAFLLGFLFKVLLVLILLILVVYFLNPLGIRDTFSDPNVHRGYGHYR
jgi:hypothetical protein